MSPEGEYGYPPQYYQAWEAMIATGNYWGMAPIHHGVFENGWRRALEAAAQVAEKRPELAAQIRALGVYVEEPR